MFLKYNDYNNNVLWLLILWLFKIKLKNRYLAIYILPYSLYIDSVVTYLFTGSGTYIQEGVFWKLVNNGVRYWHWHWTSLDTHILWTDDNAHLWVIRSNKKSTTHLHRFSPQIDEQNYDNDRHTFRYESCHYMHDGKTITKL